MKRALFFSLAFLTAFVAAGLSAEADQSTVPPGVKAIVGHSCAVSGCHRGQYPTGNLNLEPDKFLASTLNVASEEVPERKYIDSGDPEKSYLLAKIKGEPGIVGKRMPARGGPLSDDQIKTVQDWIMSLKGDDPQAPPAAAKRGLANKPAFWGTRLVNLPTARTGDKGDVLLRISHRFYPPLSIGEDGAYGLDGPAFVLLSLGYAFTDRLMVTVGRSNLDQEWELTADYKLFEPSQGSAIPLSGTIHVGGSYVGVDKPVGEVWASRFRFSALFSLSWKVTDRV